MSNKEVLLDTSIIIDFLRRKNKEKTKFYSLAANKAYLKISMLTHTELYAGKSVWEKEKAQKDLETIFGGLEILNLDPKISKQAGKIRANHTVDLIDAIIAATALEYKLPLATLNTNHFKSIPDLKILESYT